MESLGSLCRYHVISKWWHFYFSLSNLDASYFFFFSDCCDWACSVILKVVKVVFPVLFLTLGKNAFSVCPLSMMLDIDFSYMDFIMLMYDPSISTLLRIFIRNGCWILSNAFSAFMGMTVWFLSFFYVVDHIYWFVNVVQTSFPE